MFKKLYFKSWLLLLCLIVGASSAWAEEETITFSEQGYDNGTTIEKVNGTTFSIAFSKGSNSNAPKYYTSGTAIRAYGGNTFTVSSTLNDITEIIITFGSGDSSNAITTNVGTYSNGTWTGNSKSVTFTIGGSSGNRRLSAVKVTTAASSPLASIALSGEYPTSFYQGDTFSHEGMTVTATYENESTKDVTAAATFSGYDMSTTGEQEVTVSYTEGGVKKTATYYITVNAPAMLESISLSGTYQIVFTEGDEFNHDGVVVTAHYDDNTDVDVTDAAEFSTPDMNEIGAQTITVTYNDKTATYDITVNAIPSHNVTWNVNGATSIVSYKEGIAINFPENPGAIDGKVFMGWTTATIEGTTDEAPEFVTSATMGDDDITYYAVFATKEAGQSTTVVDELTNSTIGISVSNYSDWSGKTSNSSAVYAGNSAGSYSSIQLRSNSNSGIVSTTSGGKVTKVSVKWNSNTADGRTITIYGKNSAYSSASQVYSANTCGEELGRIANGTSELDVSGDYAYIGIRSQSGALYLDKISITWVSGTPDTYSEYCTTVAEDTREEAGISFAKDAETVELIAGFTGLALSNSNNVSPITWTSSNEEVATVENGVVTVIGVGVTTITASFAGDENYKNATVSYTLTVQDSRYDLELSYENDLVEVNVGETAAAPTLLGNNGNGAVTYVSNNEAVATVDAETGAVTGVAEGTTTISVSVAEAEGYKGGNISFNVKVIDPNKPGTENNPYTVAQAIDAIDNGGDVNGVYVKGIVSQVDQVNVGGYATYWISVDGTTTDQFEVYHGYYVDGVNFSSSDEIQVGDEVIVYGDITYYSRNSIYEFSAGSKLVSEPKRKADSGLAYEITAYTIILGESFEAPELTNPNSLSVVYSTTDADVANVNPETGAVAIGSKIGVATITASFEGNETYRAGQASYTISVQYPSTTTTLDITELELDLGSETTTATLTATVKCGEETIESPSITWSSNNPTVATVENGVITAVAKGTATITAQFEADGYNTSLATCVVTVINTASGIIDLSKTGEVIITEFPSLGSNSYTSVDPYVINGHDWKAENCLISGGFQLRKSDGVLTTPTIKSKKGFVITAELLNNDVTISDGTNSGTNTLTVNETSAKITISAGSVYARISSITIIPLRETPTVAFVEDVTTEVQVNATVTNAATASNSKTVTYSSSDETVATVDETGKVTGVKIGTATITASVAADADYNEASASYEITVNGIPAATITGINISEVTVGDDDVLTATYTKAQDMESDVTLTMASSDEGVLSVVDVEGEYMYEAVKGGTATVTVTITPADVDHYTTVSREFEVTVLNEEKGTTELAIWDAENEVESGSTVYGANVTLTALLATNYDGVVTATQTNDKIADVTITGENITIAPKAVGTTTITFTAPETANFEGSVAKTFALTVTAPEAKTVCEVVDAVVILNETFNGCDGTGGNDEDFASKGGALSSYGEWTLSNGYSGDACVSLGSSKSAGSATTPSLSVNAGTTYTLTFNAAPWNAESATMTVSVTGGTINGKGTATTATMTTGKWNSFEYNILATAAEMTIEFTCSQKRFFLDEVKVEIPAIVPAIPDVTIASSGYGSFCCEYPLDFSEANEDYKAWYVSKVEGTTVTFTQIKDVIAGGVPFFLYGTPGTYSLKVAAEGTETLNDNMLRGTLAPTYVETLEGEYTNFALSKGAFAKMNTGTVKANKAFLPVLTENLPSDGGARLMIVFAEDGIVTDVVKNIRRDGDSNMHYYNLKGQRVENPTKGGLYIVNGQKVVVK